MNLQQSPALRPFMGKLIVFSQVAGRASDNNIRNVVGTTARKGYYMIGMMFAPFYILLTVVAFAFLICVLFADLLCGMSATHSQLASASSGLTSPMKRLAFFILPLPLPLPLLGSATIRGLSVFVGKFFVSFRVVYPIKSPGFVCSCFIILIPLPVVFFEFFNICAAIGGICLFLSLFPICIGTVNGITLFASCGKTIFSERIFSKVLKCGWLYDFAFSALPLWGILGYSVTHGKAPILIITPLGCFQHPQGQRISISHIIPQITT